MVIVVYNINSVNSLMFFAGIRYDEDTMSEVFPKNFLWGAATSSHQVEGDNRNDWSEWEEKNAELQMLNAEKKTWPEHILKNYPNPLQRENYISGSACDHYHHFREDFDIAKSLGHSAYRFSIEWSRIEPEEGKFDEREIEHYRDAIKALREPGLEPFITLWHWTLPVWLRDKRGAENKEFPKYFLRYAQKVMSVFHAEVCFWMTLNEPEIYALNAYLKGVWPPQKKGIIAYYRVTANLIRAHRLAFRALKNTHQDIKIGMVFNMPWFESGDGTMNDAMKWGADRLWIFHVLNYIKRETDFIGLNHYFHNRIRHGFNRNKNGCVSDMGWELYPRALYHVLCDLKKIQQADLYYGKRSG